MLKNIGIIGNGFVGKAVKESFKNHFEVFIFDLDQRKANVKTLGWKPTINLEDYVKEYRNNR